MAIEHKPGQGADRLEAAIKELDSKQVKVGYFPTSRYPDGKPVAGVAVVQEFGSVSRRIPPRPFFRPAVEGSRQMQRDAIAAAVRRAVSGRQTVEQGLEQLGAAVVGEVQQTISELSTPPLAASTIRRKGHDKPLIGEHGYLLQEVTHVVESR